MVISIFIYFRKRDVHLMALWHVKYVKTKSKMVTADILLRNDEFSPPNEISFKFIIKPLHSKLIL